MEPLPGTLSWLVAESAEMGTLVVGLLALGFMIYRQQIQLDRIENQHRRFLRILVAWGTHQGDRDGLITAVLTAAHGGEGLDDGRPGSDRQAE